MKMFFLRLSQFAGIILFISFFSLLLINDKNKWDKDFWVPPGISNIFLEKKQIFEDFIIEKESINLILGSSQIRDCIIPDSLGAKWFSFSNGAQTLYNGYKFLDYYNNFGKIDTIIAGISPFDFPFSYLTRTSIISENFFIFGKDSISTYTFNKHLGYAHKAFYQKLKSTLFPSVLEFPSFILGQRKNTKQNINYELKDFLSKQGFNGRIDLKPIDVDSAFNVNPEANNVNHFMNVKKNPNMKYFRLFNSFCLQKDIHVIYILSPKTKYYYSNVINSNYDKWNAIRDSLYSFNITLWDYERINISIPNSYPYRDVEHLTYDGAKVFTEIIRKRLYETSR